MNEAQFAELVRHRPDLAQFFEYIRPGGHIKEGYYKCKATKVGDGQLRLRLAFSETMYKAYGKRGFSEDGTPIVADEIRRELKGKTFREPAWKRAIRELTKAMKEAVEATARET